MTASIWPRLIPFEGTTSLIDLLQLEPPAFSRGNPFRQLKYVEEYLRELKCQSILVERHYIDRDFIEDYSLFYSLNLRRYENSCKRLHFFSCSASEAELELSDLLSSIRTGPPKVTYQAANDFSERSYLGFSVIKPLEGSPVGRTVLRSFPAAPDDDSQQERRYTSNRVYRVHIGPIPLEVRGLAFQQQDLGVSACATTALWSALHKVRDVEEIGAPTPAQITTLATRYSLPFGRPMPSDEGLSIDQMCQALQALKVAPHVMHAENFETGQSYLYAAMRSSFPAVLIVSAEADPTIRHAVTAAGMRLLKPSRAPREVPTDEGERLLAAYIHDDRVGPYGRFNLVKRLDSLILEGARKLDKPDRWRLEFVLVPLHPKIRLGLSALREVTLQFVTEFLSIHAVEAPMKFEYWFALTHSYLSDLLKTAQRDPTQLISSISAKLDLPRYLGIARITAPNIGCVDLLLDSTSTIKNLHCLAIVRTGLETPPDCTELATRYQAAQF